MSSKFASILTALSTKSGERVDFDKRFGFQCVDWARSYAQRIGEPIGTFSGSALQGWVTGSPFTSTKWVRVYYKPKMVPDVGSIIFFDKTKSNQYGHVAIVAEGTTATKLVVSEQNAGSGNGDGVGENAIKKRSRTYAGCLGWFSLP